MVKLSPPKTSDLLEIDVVPLRRVLVTGVVEELASILTKARPVVGKLFDSTVK
jgi:hypothetical protein